MAEGLINVTRLDDPVDAIVETQGRPVSPYDELRVVDEVTGAVVPDGTPGVLLTRGPYTPRGYYAAPEANARSFTPDGFYITGDIVRLRPDGEPRGRGAQQGHDQPRRREHLRRGSGEPRLSSAVGAARGRGRDAARDPRRDGVLFAVLHDGHELDLAAVRAHFDASGVAAFKRPERLETVAELPLTKVGKIDKKALRELLAGAHARG